MLKNYLSPMTMSILGALGLSILSGCPNDTAKPPSLPTSPTLDIFLYQSGHEVIVGRSVRIAGYLISAARDTLDKERVYLSSSPVEVGNLTPIDFAFTDINDPTGFREEVIFVCRNVGFVIITAVYKDSQGNTASTDTVGIEVIANPNG